MGHGLSGKASRSTLTYCATRFIKWTQVNGNEDREQFPAPPPPPGPSIMLRSSFSFFYLLFFFFWVSSRIIGGGGQLEGKGQNPFVYLDAAYPTLS